MAFRYRLREDGPASLRDLAGAVRMKGAVYTATGTAEVRSIRDQAHLFEWWEDGPPGAAGTVSASIGMAGSDRRTEAPLRPVPEPSATSSGGPASHGLPPAPEPESDEASLGADALGSEFAPASPRRRGRPSKAP